MGPTKGLGDAAKRIGPEIGNATRAIIVGGGDIGRMTAESLIDLNVDVRIIERDRDRAQMLSESMPKAEVLLGNGTNVRLLREAGIETIDLFVASAGQDELSLVLGMLAGELGAKKRVVIVKRQDFRRIVDRLGVDASISPREMTANAIMRYIRRGRFTTLATVGENHAEMLDTVVTANTPAVGRRLAEIDLPKGVLVGAITRGQETIVPDGDTVFEPGDNVILLAEPDTIGDLEKIF
jgi:trk system potassium uptake protein TrkA